MATRFDDLFEDGPEDVERETARDVTEIPTEAVGDEAGEVVAQDESGIIQDVIDFFREQHSERQQFLEENEIQGGSPPLVTPGGAGGAMNALRSLPTRQVVKQVRNVFATRGSQRAGGFEKFREIVDRLIGSSTGAQGRPATDISALLDNLVVGPATSIARSEAGQRAREGAGLVLQDLRSLFNGDTGE